MQDRAFGWTVEMQVRAIETGLRICELPVDYHPRQGGQSKISRTLMGSHKAGRFILGTLAQLYGRRLPQLPYWLWCSAMLLVLGCILMQPHSNFQDPIALRNFWLSAGVMGLGYILSWQVKRISNLWFWSVAVLTRLLLLPMLPGDDVWCYLWEGHIQNLGFNPFVFAPNAPELEAFRTVWWSQINHMDVSAQANWIYLFPLALFVGWLLLRANGIRQFTEWYLFGLLLLTPIVHFWYFAWVVPFAVPTGNWRVRWVSLSAFVYFVLPSRLPDWQLSQPERLLLWLPFVLGWLWTEWKLTRSKND